MTTKLRFEYRFVSPAIATNMLKRNTNNRSLRASYVKRLAAAMIDGRWEGGTGEAIKFDTKKNLIDGQHRLHAVMKSGRGQTFTIVHNVPVSATLVHDTGRKRTNADQLERLGYKNAVSVAAAGKLLHRFLNGITLTRGGFLDAPILLNVLKRHPGIETSVKYVESLQKGLRRNIGRGAIPAVFHFLFATVSPQKAQEFFQGLATGAGLSVTNPVLHLRERLTAAYLSQTSKLPERTRFYLIIRAWNAFYQGKPMRRLHAPHDSKAVLPSIGGNPLKALCTLVPPR